MADGLRVSLLVWLCVWTVAGPDTARHMPTLRRARRCSPSSLQSGSLAVRSHEALCVLGAKAVQRKGPRLVQVRAALQRSVRRDSSDSRARRRCIVAARLCTVGRVLTVVPWAIKDGGWVVSTSAVLLECAAIRRRRKVPSGSLHTRRSAPYRRCVHRRTASPT